MRRIAALLALSGSFIALAMLAPAFADERAMAQVVITDAGLGTFTVTAGAKYKLQCPGNIVYYRTGNGSTDVVDAGAGDYEVDFTSNPDGMPITPRANARKLYVRPKSSAAATCNLAGVSP